MDIKNVINSVFSTARVSARSASAMQNAQSTLRAQPSQQARQFIENVSTSTSYSSAEKQGLIEAVSIADQFIQTPKARESALNDIASMGLYFKQTSTKEFPRWNLLTGLRYYGLNRNADAKGITEQQAQIQVKQSLEKVATQRQVSYDDVAARQAQKSDNVRMKETAQMFGHAVDRVSKSKDIAPPTQHKADIKA